MDWELARNSFTDKVKFEQATYTNCALTDVLDLTLSTPRISSVSGKARTNEHPKRRSGANEHEHVQMWLPRECPLRSSRELDGRSIGADSHQLLPLSSLPLCSH
jgi:hypothetical protein